MISLQMKRKRQNMQAMQLVQSPFVALSSVGDYEWGTHYVSVELHEKKNGKRNCVFGLWAHFFFLVECDLPLP